MASVLAVGPKVRGFKPGRGLWIFKGHNNPQHVFLERGKIFFEVRRKIFLRPNSSFPSPSSSCFATRWLLVRLPESSGGRIMSLPYRYHSTMVFHAHVSPGDEQLARWWPQFKNLVTPHRHEQFWNKRHSDCGIWLKLTSKSRNLNFSNLNLLVRKFYTLLSDSVSVQGQ
jgi:hypothetical protein